ncbi:MAG: LPS export ABC transporter periplasmic protein LptC [Bacteroidota bacterium]
MTRRFHLLSLVKWSFLPTGFLLLVSLFSCENDLKTIEKLSAIDTLHLEKAKEIELLYSDSGNLAVKMTSPEYVRFGGKESILEFPKGMRVIFYKEMKESSVLTAKYAVIHENTNLMEARNDVEITNLEKSEKLNTERLIWDQRKQKIYSNEFVKITTSDKVLFGQGFESDQNFDNWVIKKLSGSISINPDK